MAAYTAVDPEGESIVWTLASGGDDDFELDGGVLKFKETPDYENPTDSDTNNTYTVTVTASDGSVDSGDSTPGSNRQDRQPGRAGDGKPVHAAAAGG